MANRRSKTQVILDRLLLEKTRLLFSIDETAEEIERMSAGEIYSPRGAKVVKRLDSLTGAESALSEAIVYLEQAEGKEREEQTETAV